LGTSLGVFAPSAEALMRSRYTAYVLKLEDYLLQTWHPATRPDRLDLNDGAPIKWIGLEVKNFALSSDTTAIVTFIARYKVNGKAEKMVETSLFELIENRWFYLSGSIET
jgi:SEC-C motif-containing protein